MNLRLAWRLWGAYDQVVGTIRKVQGDVGMEGKALVTSSTFWLALLGTAVQTLPQFAPYIPQPYGSLVFGLLLVLNRVFVTKSPITSMLPGT